MFPLSNSFSQWSINGKTIINRREDAGDYVPKVGNLVASVDVTYSILKTHTTNLGSSNNCFRKLICYMTIKPSAHVFFLSPSTGAKERMQNPQKTQPHRWRRCAGIRMEWSFAFFACLSEARRRQVLKTHAGIALADNNAPTLYGPCCRIVTSILACHSLSSLIFSPLNHS